MTPLEKAVSQKGRINYCDECEQFQIVGNAAYCKVDGKLIHPIMMMRGQGTGPAYNCKKRNSPITNADKIRAMTDEELAEFMCHAVSPSGVINCSSCEAQGFCRMGHNGWLDWLKQEVKE